MWHPLTIACLHDDGFSFSQIHQPPGAANWAKTFYNLMFTYFWVWSVANVAPLPFSWGKESCQCGTPSNEPVLIHTLVSASRSNMRYLFRRIVVGSLGAGKRLGPILT